MKLRLRSTLRVPAVVSACAVALAQGVLGAQAAQPRPLTVMTQNMFQGSELEAVLGATTFDELTQGVALTYNEVVASRPAERVDAMANQIAAARPDLVGLQEAALWRTGPLFGHDASNVAFDLIDMLTSALAQRGSSYVAVAITNNLDAEAPSTLGFDVRFTDRVAVLARAELVASGSDVSNVQTHNYVARAVFNSQVLGPVPIPDGWASVDAKIRGQVVRFVTTHLSPLSGQVQIAEARELLASVGSGLPTVALGDFNALPGSTTYLAVTGAGFADSWAAIQDGAPGYTCCATAATTPDQRIDFVFIRGAVVANGAQTVGISPSDRTPSGQWPSDHAGLITSVTVG